MTGAARLGQDAFAERRRQNIPSQRFGTAAEFGADCAFRRRSAGPAT